MTSILSIPVSKRFQQWHSFRNSLDHELSDTQQLLSVAEYWGKCPVVQFYVDWDTPSSWLSPWQLIYDGSLCPSGIAICMYHTLINNKDGRWKSRAKLQLMKDKTQGIFLVVKIDEDIFLNYSLGTIFQGNPPGAELCQLYAFSSGKYIEV